MLSDTNRRRAARALRFILAAFLCAAAVVGCAGSVESRLVEVRALQASGQFDASIEPLREILADSPDLPEANHLLGVALMQTGQASLAVWSLEKAARSPDYAVTAGLLLGSTFLQLENYEAAIRAADGVLAADPNSAAAFQIRAHGNLGMGRREESLADTQRLLETDPDGYRPNLFHAVLLAELGRLDESEKAHLRVRDLAAAGSDPALAAKGCVALAKFYEDNRKDLKRTEEALLDCLERHPGDPFTVQVSTHFFDRQGQPERSTDIVRRAVQEAPESLDLRVELANRLRRAEDPEAGEAVLLEAAQALAGAGAWSALSDFRRQQGNTSGALEAMERALEAAPGKPDALRFRHADLLAEAGQLDRAAEVGESLEEPAYRDLIRGRVLLERGDAAGALAALDAGIRRWPNNSGARYTAGVAAQRIGDFDRAISELRESLRADGQATDAALALAQIRFQQGDAADALRYLTHYFEKRNPNQAEALLLAARVHTRLGRHADAVKCLDRVEQHEGKTPRVVTARAAVEREAKGPEAALAVVEKSGLDLLDPANEDVLRWQVGQLVDLARTDAALAQIDAALQRSPKRGSLLEMRGAAAARGERMEPAQQAFLAALELEPQNARALHGMASLSIEAGDLPAALQYAQRAAEADPANSAAAYLAAQLTLAQGDAAGAEARLREIVRRDPSHAGARNDLAWLLADRNQELDLALRLAEEAQRIEGRPEVLDTLGWVRIQRGEYAAALEVLEQAVAGLPESGSVRYRLALALAKQGNTERALAELREALDAGDFPEAQAAKRELAQLENR